MNKLETEVEEEIKILKVKENKLKITTEEIKHLELKGIIKIEKIFRII